MKQVTSRVPTEQAYSELKLQIKSLTFKERRPKNCFIFRALLIL